MKQLSFFIILNFLFLATSVSAIEKRTPQKAHSTVTSEISNDVSDSDKSLPDNPLPEPDEDQQKATMPLSGFEFTLSVIILIFGFVLIILEMILIKIKQISSEDAIKFVIITLIITSSLYLITAGYSNDQIAPAVGLLGTIAGYLLGKTKP